MARYSIGTAKRDGDLGLKHVKGTPAPNLYNPLSQTTL